MTDEVLEHHGVKGQQWGVRHGPPYPLDGTGDISIKQGTQFKRLSVYDEADARGHAYVNYLKSDSRRYRGFFGARLKALNKGAPVYSHTLEAKNDMLAPSRQKRVETFIELYKNDPTGIGKSLGDYYKDNKPTILPRKFYETKYSKLNFQNIESKGYSEFVRAIGGDEKLANKYFDALSKKGYSFVTDDMDGGKFGKEPSIIFDRQKSTFYVGKEEIPLKEIMQTWKEEGTYLKKDKS